MRFLSFVLMIILFNSCDYFSLRRKSDYDKINPKLDTTTVDIPPSLGRCNTLIDKQEKTTCFYKEMSKAFAEILQDEDIKVKRDLDETVNLVIRIDSNGKSSLKSIDASENIYKEIPNFKQLIEKAVDNLPQIVAAVKKEVPVTTEYRLPIKVTLKN